MPTHDIDDKTTQRIVAMFAAGEFDVCTLIYAEFRSAISQIVTPQQLIPFAPPKAKKKDGEEQAPTDNGLNGAVYEYEPGEEEILTALLPTNISVQVFKGLLEKIPLLNGLLFGLENVLVVAIGGNSLIKVVIPSGKRPVAAAAQGVPAGAGAPGQAGAGAPRDRAARAVPVFVA